jgi:hypothetical protein
MQNSRCWEMAAYILKPSTHVIRCWEMARYMQQCACHVVGKWPFACPRRNYIVQSQTRRDDTVTQTRTLRCWEMACLSHVSEQVFRATSIRHPSIQMLGDGPAYAQGHAFFDVGKWLSMFGSG